jgi:hypothetical protein
MGWRREPSALQEYRSARVRSGLVGGAKTSEATIRRAAEFYTSIGQRTVRLNKEMPGHVANRLQSALAREVYYLVAEGQRERRPATNQTARLEARPR